jgi:hypothetical protein
MSALIASCCRPPAAAPDARVQVADAVVGVEADLLQRPRRAWRTRRVELADAWPNMMGSETFIIVALRCSENSTSFFASSICEA